MEAMVQAAHHHLSGATTQRDHRVLLVALPGGHQLDLVGMAEVFEHANRRRQLSGRTPYAVEVASLECATPLSSAPRLLFTGGNPIDVDAYDTVVLGGGDIDHVTADRALVELISRLCRFVPRVACTWAGAFLLASTGLLNGKRATIHWTLAERFVHEFPEIRFVPEAIFVRDGKFLTCAGATAAIDMALSLVEEDLGLAATLTVAHHLVLFVRRPGGQAQLSGPLRAELEGLAGDRFNRLSRWILDNLEHDLRVDMLARRAAMSPRNFARRFRSKMGITPAQYVRLLRVDAARCLLSSGSLPVSAVAARCGFGSVEAMRLAFQRHLREPPQAFRARCRQPVALGFSAPHNLFGALAPVPA